MDTPRYEARPHPADPDYGMIWDRTRNRPDGMTVPLADAVAEVARRNAQVRRYLLVKAAATDNYLGFGAEVEEIVGPLKIVSVPVEHATWQHDRYASGGQLAHHGSLATRAEARAVIDRMDG